MWLGDRHLQSVEFAQALHCYRLAMSWKDARQYVYPRIGTLLAVSDPAGAIPWLKRELTNFEDTTDYAYRGNLYLAISDAYASLGYGRPRIRSLARHRLEVAKRRLARTAVKLRDSRWRHPIYYVWTVARNIATISFHLALCGVLDGVWRHKLKEPDDGQLVLFSGDEAD